MNGEPKSGWPDDEVLMAFADGRLAKADTVKVAEHLETDAEARHFVELLQRSGKLAQTAFEDAMAAPPSPKLLETIMGSGAQTVAEAQSAQPSNVVPLRPRQRLASWASHTAMPLAASIALLVGSLAGYQLGQRAGQPSGAADAPFELAVGPSAKGSVLSNALDTLVSGDSLTLKTNAPDQQGELMIVASFFDKAGRACRELEITQPSEAENAITGAVACRRGDSGWYVEGAALMASAPPIPDKDFSPASGDGTSAMEGILKSIGAKPALSKVEENALLGRGWK